MKYCRNCGTQLDDNTAFCPECGAKQDEININQEEQVEYIEQPDDDVEYIEEVHYVDAETGEEIEYVEEDPSTPTAPVKESDLVEDDSSVALGAAAVGVQAVKESDLKEDTPDDDISALERKKELLLKKQQLQKEIDELEGKSGNSNPQNNNPQNNNSQSYSAQPFRMSDKDIIDRVRGIVIIEGIIKLAMPVLMVIILYLIIQSVIVTDEASPIMAWIAKESYGIKTDSKGFSLETYAEFGTKLIKDDSLSDAGRNMAAVVAAFSFAGLGFALLLGIFTIIGLIRGVIAFIQGLVGSTSRVNSRFRYCGTMFFTTLTLVPGIVCMIMIIMGALHEGNYEKINYYFEKGHYKQLTMESSYKTIIALLVIMFVLYIFAMVMAGIKSHKVNNAKAQY